MQVTSRHIALMFLILFFLTLRILPPFSQADIPVGVTQTQYYKGKGILPIIEIPHPNIGVDIYVVEGSPPLYYSNVIFLGNMLINILTFSCAVFFWRARFKSELI